MEKYSPSQQQIQILYEMSRGLGPLGCVEDLLLQSDDMDNRLSSLGMASEDIRKVHEAEEHLFRIPLEGLWSLRDEAWKRYKQRRRDQEHEDAKNNLDAYLVADIIIRKKDGTYRQRNAQPAGNSSNAI